MERKFRNLQLSIPVFIIVFLCTQITGAWAQCDPTYIYGLTNVGMIQRINVTDGSVSAPINPAFTGNAPNLSNAMGYNPLNGKYYFFKRNITTAPQEFMSFDPATNLYASLAPSPGAAGNIINLGCLNATGLGYYCLDAFGTLYYYDVALDTWTTICSNIKDQFGTTLASVIGAGSLNRFYGDIAFDGDGNLWALISGPADYGLYRIAGPLPTTTVTDLTAEQLLAPNTPSPGGTFGGIAFSAGGAIYLSSNSPNNKLYRLSNGHTLSFVTNLGLDGIGNDLTSCNFPLSILAATGIKLSATLVNNNTVVLNWKSLQSANSNGYEVQRSADGISWATVHFSLKKTGELSTTYTYSEDDLPNGTQYYRIRETDNNGKVTYSAIEKVNAASDAAIRIWPNPVQDKLQVQSAGNISQLFVYDLSGRILNASDIKNGINAVAVNTLQPGTYIVQVKLAGGGLINKKFVKQ
jgi:hypothetical protein